MADLLLSNIVFSESNLLKISPRGQSMASTKTMAGCLSETVVNFAIIFENIKTLASVYNTKCAVQNCVYWTEWWRPFKVVAHV